MKVLLINPPQENIIAADNPLFIEEERGNNPPIGLLYVASYARENTDAQIEVLDTQVEGVSYQRLGQIIKEKAPNMVGITATTFTLIDAIETARIVKKASKDIKVVVGGIHSHIYSEETINIPEIDYVILGEGEIPLANLIKNLNNPSALRKTEGIVFKDDGKIVNNGPEELIANLDILPFPARDLTPYKKYSSLLAKRKPITTMITSRGCPYQCTYCARPQFGKKFRARSAENVVNEIQECLGMGIREFLIYDDTFTIDRKRVLNICNEILNRKLEIGWDIRARVDNVDEEMLKRLRDAGCERIHYGVEAGTDKILKVLKKGITLEQVKEAFKLTKKAGISTLAYFMIGSPRETKEDISKTIKLAKELDPDFAHITVTTPFPATELYSQGLEEGVISYDYWREFAQNPKKDFQTIYWERILSRKELFALLNYAYKSFYSRPGYILKELLKIRSLGELKRKTKAGWKVLRA